METNHQHRKRPASSPRMNGVPEKRVKRPRVSISSSTTSLTSSAASTSTETEPSHQPRTLTMNKNCCSGNSIVRRLTCASEHVNLDGLNDNGAIFHLSGLNNSVGLRSEDDQIKRFPVLERGTKNATKTATRFNRSKFVTRKEIIEEQFLDNLVRCFCKNYGAPVDAEHFALSIVTACCKTVRARRLRGNKGKGKFQTREEALAELAAASLFISVRHFNCGISLRQILTELNARMDGIKGRMKEIKNTTGISPPPGDPMEALRASLARSSDALKLAPDLINAVQTLAEGALLNLSQRFLPATLIASCIFLVVQVANASYSKGEIVAATSVSWDSIRKRYKLLLPNAEELLPQDFKQKFGDKLRYLVNNSLEKRRDTQER